MKKDKKFELNYFKLNYYKKLIRTFWMAIIVILVPVICFIAKVPKVPSVVLSIVLLILWSILLLYNAIHYYLEDK